MAQGPLMQLFSRGNLNLKYNGPMNKLFFSFLNHGGILQGISEDITLKWTKSETRPK
jgi:hypothetical protein